MATLIRTPTRSGVVRQLGVKPADITAPPNERVRPEPTEAPLAPVSSAAHVPDVVPAQSEPEASVESQPVRVPAYDADAYTAMLTHANERAQAAEQELEALKTDLERIREEARSVGYAAGAAQARGEQDAETQKLRAEFAALLGALHDEIVKSATHAEVTLVEIAYTAACRIIGAAAISREAVAGTVSTAVQAMTHQQEIVVHVSEHDYRLLVGDAAARHSEATPYRIVADGRVKLGGCIVEGAAGSLDARLEVQLQRLKDTLVSAHAQAQADG